MFKRVLISLALVGTILVSSIKIASAQQYYPGDTDFPQYVAVPYQQDNYYYQNYNYNPDYNPYYQNVNTSQAVERKTAEVIKGAALGATIGALGSSHNHGTAALKGMGIGAVAGLLFGR